MKLINLVPLALTGLAVTMSCSQPSLQSEVSNGARAGAGGSSEAMSGAGGTTGGTTGGTMSAGGTTGGSVSTGATGGSMVGAGGSATGGTGGTTGGTTGGSVSMGGMGGTGAIGMTTGGSSGAPATTGGSAGMSAGGGGGMMTGGGGMAGMTTGAGGMSMAGATGTAGAGGTLDPNTLVPGLDGWYWEIDTTNGQNPGGNNYWLTDNGQQCPQNSDWNQAGVTRSKDFKMMGTSGTKYTINFELRGAMGFRCYTGGMAAQTQPNANSPNNGFYVGGQQYNNSIWNTYELDVQSPPVTGATSNTYFLNGIPSTSNACDQELTYEMRYTASFQVMGDSTLHFSTHDTNCKAQQNCGPTPTTSCAPRSVDLSGMSPAATFTQPVANTIGGTTFYPQWLYFDVKSITSP